MTADVIINLYMSYQRYNFVLSVCTPIVLLFLALDVVLWVTFCIEGVDSSFGFRVFLIATTIFWACNVVLVVYSKYQIDCVLKVEAMRYLAPASLDLFDKVGKEVVDMWGVLKATLLAK